METKICSKCKVERGFEEFHKREKGRIASHCKECKNKWQKVFRTYHKKEQSMRDSEYADKHPLNILARTAKNRAKKFGVPFDSDFRDVIIPNICPILGIPLFRSKGKQGPGPNSPSLDRIIPELGYVKGNRWIISHMANTMKSYGTLEQMVLLGKWAKSEIDKRK